jgi:hypothetical protein
MLGSVRIEVFVRVKLPKDKVTEVNRAVVGVE